MAIKDQHRLSHWLTIVPVLLLALGIRLHEMNSQSLWFDEAGEFNVAARPLSEVVAADQSGTLDPPLFSLTLNLWMQAGRTDFHVRMLPVFASVLAVAVVFVLGRTVYSPAVGWFSALLVAMAPRAVYYGFELNQYAYVLLLAPFGTLLLERYLRYPRLMRLIVFILAGVVAMLTHYELAIYWGALILVATFSLLLNRSAPNRRRLLAQWFGGLAVLALLGFVFLWAYTLPQQMRLPETYAPSWFFNQTLSVTGEIGKWVVQTEEQARTLLWNFEAAPLAWITSGLLLVGTLLGLFRPGHRLSLYFIASLILSYCMAGAGFLSYWHRYVLYALPLEVLLICSGVFALTGGRYRRYLRPVAYLGLGILAILLFVRLPEISGQPFPETEQFGDVMAYLQAHYQDGDAVYVYYGARPAFVRYGSEALVRTAVIQRWARGIPAEKQQADMWSAVGAAPRVWLLVSHGGPPDATFLRDALRSRCRQQGVIEVTGSAGYLFECPSAQS